MGFLLWPASRGTQRSHSRSRKRQMRRRRNPSGLVALCPILSPCACVTGASATMEYLPVVLTGPRRDGIHSLCPVSAAGSFCASFPLGSRSPVGPLLRVYYFCEAYPHSIKSSFVVENKRGGLLWSPVDLLSQAGAGDMT